jgi:hypothetical protein
MSQQVSLMMSAGGALGCIIGKLSIGCRGIIQIYSYTAFIKYLPQRLFWG